MTAGRFVDAAQRLAKHSQRRGTCLIYTRGYTARSGHTMVSYLGKQTGVHVVAYRLARGEVPKGLCVCHTCDVGRCIEPSHLWLGTVGQNNRDRDAKGRGVVPPVEHRRPTARPTVHGTVSAYVKRGCRCGPCRQANSDYRRAKRLPEVPR